MVKWNWEDMSNAQRMAIRTDFNTPGRSTKQECTKQAPLGSAGKNPFGLVHITCPIHCRITRKYGGRSKCLDDDNMSGGAKSLRDAITSILGLKGDSEADGITFEYAQEKGEVTETVIKIFSKKK